METSELEFAHDLDGSEEALYIPSYPAVAVSATLLLFALFFGILWLYESKLSPSHLETTWLDSQRQAPQPGLAPLNDDTVINLHRYRCFGRCSAYQVSIFGSGRVEFNGEAFVCEKGPATAQIDPAAMQTLLNGLAIVGFDDMPNYTREDATDAPTATVTLTRPTGLHIVHHYHGDDSAPRLLNWIEDRIDEVAGSAMWVGGVNHYRGYCVEKDTQRSHRNAY